ncbi:hypothetical protein [Deinococcus aerophilus]|uniref:Uncharacterized protein n=1 Tax=Deinococcus aerophilus TaxID=522488 RepID=A0ABQ2H2A7_9DEIO|nr:hypothetical protein [Deinococcus aerophilus]GGM22418.1 hypothetical protein GCM10010841_32880 [Deinococcus aerophilus]
MRPRPLFALLLTAGLAACGTGPSSPGVPLSAQATNNVTGLTAPAGFLRLGNDLWVSDHLLGFCRVDSGRINSATCNTSAGSPGQAAYDPATGLVYVPDKSAKGSGVWRLKYNPTSRTVFTQSAPLLGGNVLGSARPTAAALTADGRRLFIVSGRDGKIVRLDNPAGNFTGSVVGQSSDGRGMLGAAILGLTLYVAEKGGVTQIGVDCVASAVCLANPTGLGSAAPTAVNAFSDPNTGTDRLYVADAGSVSRYTFQGGEFLGAETASGFQGVTGLGLDVGNVYVGQDPSGAGTPLAGFVSQLSVNTGDWTDGGVTAPPPSGTFGTPTPVVKNLTSPGGVLRIGNDLWVADHLFGLCRLDGGLLNINTCNLSAVSPGQPAFDPVTNSVYVPDNSAKGTGVWRLRYNPSSRTLSTVGSTALGSNVLNGNRPTATALTPDGRRLFVTSLKNGNVIAIDNPSANFVGDVVGQTSDGRRATSLTMANGSLYLAENGGVTVMDMTCSKAAPCKANPSGLGTTAPTALASFTDSDGNSTVDVADGNAVLRFSFRNGEFVNQETLGTAFAFPTAMLAEADQMYVADDPSQGATALSGRLWSLPTH